MSRRCVRCGKPLSRPAAEAGAYAWGPRCAVLAGLVKRKRRKRISDRAPAPDIDPRQLALVLPAR